VLAQGFRAGGNVRVFAQGWCAEAAAFQPAIIAGSKDQLLALAGTRVSSLTHALVVVLQMGEEPVRESERERLWRSFGVPLFEQIVDPFCRLIAGECEAHDGLHVVDQEMGLELVGYLLDAAPCGCGKKTVRLRAAGGREIERVAAHAG
jgi:hypothetical protein